MNTNNIRLEIYKKQREKLSAYVNYKWDSYNLKNFHFMSANLSKFLPNIHPKQHKLIYLNILSYRALQSIDTRFYENFNSISGIHDFSKKIKDNNLPGIFVSYHLGSFRSAMAFLIKANLNVVLIVDPLPYQLQKEDIIGQYEILKKYFNSTSELIIFPADKKDLSVQILTKTKQNYSVLAFIDGNTGFNGAFNQKNTVKINFLGQTVSFRRGLAMLSYYTKCPLYPMLSYYDKSLKPHWKIYKPIYPSIKISAQQYSENTIEKLFNILEKALKAHPDQWEGWLYLHKFLEIKSDKVDKLYAMSYDTSSEFILNQNTGLFNYDNKFYALNKENYRIIELTQDIFKKLTENETFKKINFDENVKFLVDKGVLINKKMYETIG